MIGEIRDGETAEMALRAAQTGHLLMSTLHTTTAVESVRRLRDLGIDANTIASTLAGVMGQRLVRRVCKECKAPYQPSKHLLDQLPFSAQPLAVGAGQGLRLPVVQLHRLSAAAAWWRSCGCRRRMTRVLIAKEVPMDELAASTKASTFTMAQCASELLTRA